MLHCPTAHAGILALTTLDAFGEPLPCRILVRGSDNLCAVPDGAVTLQTLVDLTGSVVVGETWSLRIVLFLGEDEIVSYAARVVDGTPDTTCNSYPCP